MKRMAMTMVLLLRGVLLLTAQEQTDSTLEARLDSIEMEAEMKGVAVTAQRSLVTNDIDRVAYDVEHDEEARVLSVLDMLRRVPYVTVDGDDNIKVKGSSAFKIYKNGRRDMALSRNAKETLRAMPATMVRRIEVITDPGAREDAEGVEAILNIVLMDNKRMKGLMGSLSGSYNTLNHPNLGAFLTTQFGKLTTSLDYGYGGMSRRETNAYSDAWTAYPATGNCASHTDKHQSPGFVHYADVNASLEMDSLNLISASFGGYFYNLNVQGDQQTTMRDVTGQTLYAYDKHYWMPDYLHHSWQGRLDYEHKTHRQDERWTFSYMLALTRQHSDSQADYSNALNAPFGYTGFLTRAKEHFAEHTLQLDWLRPLGRGHQLETGAKYIFRQNRSRNRQDFYYNSASAIQHSASYEGLTPDTKTRFLHRTQVGALYADYIYRHRRWSARAGLRYEFSTFHIDGSDELDVTVTSHSTTWLHDWMPQLSAKWQMTDRQSMKLGFTTAIQRPGIEYLNPAVERSPLSVSSGNAKLKSCRSQNLHLIYMYVGQRLTLNLAPACKWSRNGIGPVQTAQGDVRYSTYGNVVGHRRFQLEGYVQWKPFQKTTLVVNANVGQDRYENAQASLRNRQFSGFLYSYVAQEMWWRLRLTVAGFGQVGHEPTGVYGYSKPWWSGSLSLQRSFLRDDCLTVRLGANIPFTEYKGYTSRTTQGDYLQWERQHMRSRSFTLSVSYRFGRLKADVKKAEARIENDDVVGGITKGR